MSSIPTPAEELQIAKWVETLYENDYRRPSLEECVDVAYSHWRSVEYDNRNSSDWPSHHPPTKFDWRPIYNSPHKSKHLKHKLVIRRSEENDSYIGLYCSTCSKLIQWINDYQVYDLMRPGTRIKNFSGTTGEYPL